MIARALPPGFAASWRELRADLSAIVDHLSDCCVVLGKSVHQSARHIVNTCPGLVGVLATTAEYLASQLTHEDSATATPKTQREYLEQRNSGKEQVSGQDRASSPRFPALPAERKRARTKMQVSSSALRCLPEFPIADANASVKGL